jgi:hypothetical protein
LKTSRERVEELLGVLEWLDRLFGGVPEGPVRRHRDALRRYVDATMRAVNRGVGPEETRRRFDKISRNIVVMIQWSLSSGAGDASEE